jgi:hypothetical protein
MNKKFLLTTVKIVAFGVVPFMVDSLKKGLEKSLSNIEKEGK